MNKYYNFIVFACCIQSFLYCAESTPRPTILLPPPHPQHKSKIQASTVAQETLLSPQHYFQERVHVKGFWYLTASLFPSIGLAEDIKKTYLPAQFTKKHVLLYAAKPKEKFSDDHMIAGAKKLFLCSFQGSDGKEYPIPFASVTRSLAGNHYIKTPKYVDERIEPKPLR